MKPIKIRIRKKTLVPTKYQCNHKYRSDWKLVGVIDYNDSFGIFSSINAGGLCDNEAQFAKLIYDNYGEGIYSCIAWTKGTFGFFGFWKAELTSYGFRRLPKTKTSEALENEKNISEIRKLKKQLASNEISEEEKRDIKEEISELSEDMGLNSEIMELDNSTVRRGPSGYLKCMTPIYKMHSYEKYGKDKNTIEGEKVDFY